MSKPRLLDLFCCEGGAGKGYADAGFEVVGVDLTPRFAKRYPFTFINDDAIAYVQQHGHEFDVIHASPPCQSYSITKHTHKKSHPDLVGPTRDALISSGKPYVIENVPGAPLKDPLVLCGTEFALIAMDPAVGRVLHLKRHRLFESNVSLVGKGGCRCKSYKEHGYLVGGVYGGGSTDLDHAQNVRHGGYTPARTVRQRLVGVDWMTLHGMNQCIPPAYTHHLGLQLIGML